MKGRANFKYEKVKTYNSSGVYYNTNWKPETWSGMNELSTNWNRIGHRSIAVFKWIQMETRLDIGQSPCFSLSFFYYPPMDRLSGIGVYIHNIRSQQTMHKRITKEKQWCKQFTNQTRVLGSAFVFHAFRFITTKSSNIIWLMVNDNKLPFAFTKRQLISINP